MAGRCTAAVLMSPPAAVQLLLLLALMHHHHATIEAAPRTPRHIVLMLVDELGTGDVPWSDPELHAPTIKLLGEGGLRLGHQYAWHWCAPTRSALMVSAPLLWRRQCDWPAGLTQRGVRL